MLNSTALQTELLEALQPDVPYLTAYEAVRIALEAAVPFGHTWSTEEMVEMVAPAASWVHGDREIVARRRVYKALNALSEHGLKSWVTLGTARKGKFGMIRPKLWRRTRPCEFCNGTGIAPE